MGSCNPKPQSVTPPSPNSLELCCKRLKYHLQIKQSKINQEIIATESQLVRKVKCNKNERNMWEQLLIAERVVNGLKYTTVYTLLTEYSSSLNSFACFICQNINNPKKIQPFQHKVSSIMYAAQKIPLSTLQQFKKCMEYVDDPLLTEQHADQQVKNYLTPHPTPEEINVYMMEMAERNNLSIEKINEGGHGFGAGFKPSSWDNNELKSKRKIFRDSLPKQMIEVKTRNQSNVPSNCLRCSITNPFDKGKVIEPKNSNPNGETQITAKQKDNLDNSDMTPNITEVMKRMSHSGEA